MEFLFLLAFGEKEFFIAFAMACSEAFFNELLVIPIRSPIDPLRETSFALLQQPCVPIDAAAGKVL
jgi:hypothetical protein